MIEPQQAMTIVEGDVETALAQALRAEGAGHGFRIHDGFEWVLDTPVGSGAGNAVSIPWQWTGMHRDELLGFFPQIGEELELTVSGLTVVQEVDRSDEAPDGLLLHRFVDWLQTLNDLGARSFVRPVVDIRRRDEAIGGNARFQQVLVDNQLTE